jgi:tetratricopeptide (TPR) repeat protein
VTRPVAAERLLAAIERQRAGHVAEAEALYRATLADDPVEATALRLCGLLCLGEGRAPEAAELLARAADAAPEHGGVWLALAHARLGANRPEAALQAATTAGCFDPQRAEAHFLRGTALNALQRPAEAAEALHRAVALDPGHACAHLNLGNAYADLDRPDQAERFCRVAVRLDAALAEAHASLGFALTALGRLDEAIASCEAAIALRPDFAQAHWNRATACLLAGDFDTGFAEYEWRKRHDQFRRDFLDLPGPFWDGEPLAGRTILVHAEQGLGDTIQLSRFLPLLAERGARVALACDVRLIPLLRTLRGVAELVERGGPLPRYDVWVDQMSLPRLFGLTPDAIPAASGYLTADPARVAAWRAALADAGAAAKRKVGLVWAGNPRHSNDGRRSLPPAQLSRLLSAPGVQFVSLQVGPRSGEASQLPDLSRQLTDYAETAAAVSALDLVVTVDTSVAHLAGALAVDTWVMLPAAPDWRWMLGRDDTPWYASMRLIRQRWPGDWDGVVDAVIAGLAA